MHHESAAERHHEAPRLSEQQLAEVVTSLGGKATERVAATSHEASVVTSEMHQSLFGDQIEEIQGYPVQPSESPAVFYSHGAGWGRETPTVKKIADFGRRSFSYVHHGERTSDKKFLVGTGADTQESGRLGRTLRRAIRTGERIVPKQLMREGATLNGLIEERRERGDTAPIDAIFQSASAGPGMIAVHSVPENFRNVVLAFPGGFGPQKNVPWKLAKESVAKRRSRTVEEESFITRTGRMFTAADALRRQVQSSGFFANAAALRFNSSVPHLLHEVKSRENAPKVTLVAGLDDKLFPIEKYLKQLQHSEDVDQIVVVPGAHGINGRSHALKTILSQFPLMEFDRDINAPLGPLADRISLPDTISKRRRRRIEKLVKKLDQRSGFGETVVRSKAA